LVGGFAKTTIDCKHTHEKGVAWALPMPVAKSIWEAVAFQDASLPDCDVKRSSDTLANSMATAPGTRRFFERIPSTRLPNAFGKLQVSKLGFGCYRVEKGNAEQKEAMMMSINSGCNVIDTSPNYRNGLSEALVNDVVGDMIRGGQLQRDEVLISTKAGYIQGPEMAIAAEREREGNGFTGITKVQDGFWHSMSPDFLDHQLAMSTLRLGTPPDVLLLHNPEYYLTNELNKLKNEMFGKHSEIQNYAPLDMPGDPRSEIVDAFYERMRVAFGFLEEMVAAGRIQSYGISSNVEGCFWSVSGGRNTYERTSIDRMVAEAIAVGGEDHHMRTLQIPLNVCEGGAFLRGGDTNGDGGAIARAVAHGVSVVANRPLNVIPPPGIQTVLITYSRYLYCTHAVHMLYSCRTHAVLMPYSCCTHAVLMLYSYCTHCTHCTHCTLTVLILLLYSYCPPTALVMPSYCPSRNALQLPRGVEWG
jgi:aryl-alcohol dehydrogenase-like predicted oxidoreductase